MKASAVAARAVLLALVFALLPLLAPAAHAGASATTTDQTRVCPFEGVGGDPDYLQLHQILPGYWVITASEAEAAQNLVTLAVHFDGTGHATVNNAGASSGLHNTRVVLWLVAGATYTLDFAADFDFGLHPCSSAGPGQTPFTFVA